MLSAGELESDRAGEPGRMIRQRYRRAAEVSKMHGKFSCLLINDIDAGALVHAWQTIQFPAFPIIANDVPLDPMQALDISTIRKSR